VKIAYISGPYRSNTPSGIVKNIRNAEDVAIKYWKKGYAVICPHKNTALFDGLCDDNTWLSGDIAILKRCDVIIMIPGWEESYGARAEYAIAKECGIKILEDNAQ
jgi:hypothetical protein